MAGIAAGLVAVPEPAPWTLVLACDLVRPERAVDALLRAADDTADVDGFVAVDEDGRRQPLLALYRSSALREAVQALGDPTDAAVRRLTAGLARRGAAVRRSLCGRGRTGGRRPGHGDERAA